MATDMTPLTDALSHLRYDERQALYRAWQARSDRRESYMEFLRRRLLDEAA